MLVKLEKEIEMEETRLLAEEPPAAVKTFSLCCQHGGLYHPGVSVAGGAGVHVWRAASRRGCMCEP